MAPRISIAVALAGVLLGVAGPAALPALASGCATTSPGGGDWRTLGGDLSGARTQAAESQLGTSNIANLAARWSFSANDLPTGGTFSGTPVVADGCVFIEASAGSSGTVVALNADDGSLVWTHQVFVPTSGLGGALVGSPAVDSGKLFVLVNGEPGPSVLALDELTGAQLWSTVYDSFPGSFTNASAVAWNGLVFAGIAGDEYGSDSRGGFAVLDQGSGAVLAHTYTISDAEYAQGYRGASVWATAAIDPATGFAYVGTGNPGGSRTGGNQARIAAPDSNAILKIDLNRTSTTFGKIVGVYRGNSDQYVDGLDQQPACDMLGNQEYGVDPNLHPAPAWSVACAQLDLDFGASPALFSDAAGHAVVGELQKSGVYHVALRDTMGRDWSAIVGGPCFACNAGTPAVDVNGIFAEGTPGGVMEALNNAGRYLWASPMADGAHYDANTTANGVLYTLDTEGNLAVFDESTGLPLVRRPVSLDLNTPSALAGGQSNIAEGVTSTGVSVARHRLFAAVGSFIVAYGVTGVS